jgi:DNA-binding transcriptional ArsR family regulator
MRNRSVTHSAKEYSPEITFHALGDSTRLAVLKLLRDQPQSVGQIAAAFPISRPAISKHLRQLHKARLVVPTRSGRHRFYRINVEPLEAVDSWLAQYRMFWTQKLSSLKSFVEEAHARETGRASVEGPNVGRSRARRSKHK